jgi:hypothetical protein
MSFFSFLFSSFRKKDRTTTRMELEVPCKFIVYAPHEEPKDKLMAIAKTGKAGFVINSGSTGLGIVTIPPFTKEYSETIEKEHCIIFIEAHSLQSNTHQKMCGQIRWVKTITNVKDPYSEIGILIKSVEDETQSQFLDSIFDPPKENP